MIHNLSYFFITVGITLTFICCPCYVRRSEAARIFAVQTIPAKSHWNFVSGVLRALTNGGHNVTVFTPFLDGNRPNYTEVDISSMFQSTLGLTLSELKQNLSTQYRAFNFMFEVSRRSCDKLHANRQLNELLAYRLRTDFDAIILQPGVLTDCMKNLLDEVSDVPLIYCMPYPTTPSNHIDVGHIPNPAVTSSLMSDHAVPRTFAQRFSNVLVLFYTTVGIRIRERWLSVIDPKPFDTPANIPPALVFVNRHFISDAPSPVPTNVIDVAGVHLKPIAKIPKDILEFIEESPHGIILFSLGSIAAFSSTPENVRIAIQEAFMELPQRVIMKYEGEWVNKPDNMMTRKWIPQRDILMHPNVKLFICHGGISGLYEAVDAGVPIIGFPLFNDQYRNVDHLVEVGMAIKMELLSVTKEEILKNIRELLDHEKYATNAKIVADIFHDRPMSPEQSVVYWTEYVIRHKGAPHLKSYAINLSWYQYFLLDVIAVISVLYFASLLILIKLFQIVRKRIV